VKKVSQRIRVPRFEASTILKEILLSFLHYSELNCEKALKVLEQNYLLVLKKLIQESDCGDS